MNTITVKNTTRTMFVLNLTRGGDYGPDFLPTRIPFDSVETDQGGNVVGVRKRVLAQPASITWLPGETREDIPASVRVTTDFRKAESVGSLRVV